MDFDAEFQRATALRDDWQFEAARELLERLSAEHPESFGVWLVLGGVQFEQKDYPAAEISFSIAANLAPRSELASLSLFHTLRDLGRVDEAFAEMRRFLALRPESIEYELLRKELASGG